MTSVRTAELPSSQVNKKNNDESAIQQDIELFLERGSYGFGTVRVDLDAAWKRDQVCASSAIRRGLKIMRYLRQRSTNHHPLRMRAERFLREPFSAFGRYRDLTLELTRRDILGRYREANFGLLWSLLGPLMMLVIYTIAFGKIFGARWNQVSGDNAAFGMVLFLGILTHGFFAECLSRSPRLMVENANYVKKVIFPLHVLPWSVLMSALFHMAMNLVIFTVLNVVLYGKLSPYLLLTPIVIAPLVLMAIAVSWLMASLGVYLRDVNQAVPVISTALLFLSSAIVPVDTLPEHYQLIFKLNPLTFFIDEIRDVALWGRLPDWEGLAVRTVIGTAILYLAYGWFRLTSKGFADVL